MNLLRSLHPALKYIKCWEWGPKVNLINSLRHLSDSFPNLYRGSKMHYFDATFDPAHLTSPSFQIAANKSETQNNSVKHSHVFAKFGTVQST